MAHDVCATDSAGEASRAGNTLAAARPEVADKPVRRNWRRPLPEISDSWCIQAWFNGTLFTGLIHGKLRYDCGGKVIVPVSSGCKAH